MLYKVYIQAFRIKPIDCPTPYSTESCWCGCTRCNKKLEALTVIFRVSSRQNSKRLCSPVKRFLFSASPLVALSRNRVEGSESDAGGRNGGGSAGKGQSAQQYQHQHQRQSSCSSCIRRKKVCDGKHPCGACLSSDHGDHCTFSGKRKSSSSSGVSKVRAYSPRDGGQANERTAASGVVSTGLTAGAQAA